MGDFEKWGLNTATKKTYSGKHYGPWSKWKEVKRSGIEEKNTEGRALTLFIDSSYVIALADEDDQYHKVAKELVKVTGGEKVISDLILSESITGVGSRLGSEAGSKVFETLLYDRSTNVVFLNKRLCERSLHLYLKYGRRLSFADTISVRIMYDRKIKSIVSFDSDFDGIEGVSRISGS